MGGKMESLNLQSPTIIQVVGIPGAGKSFFAKQFAGTLGISIVSIDKIRWTLFAHHTYSENENLMVKQVSDLLVTELLKTQKSFVLDGGYNEEVDREEIAKRAQKAGFRILTVVVQTDEPTAKRRATKRNARTAGDRHKQSMSSDEFKAQVKQFDVPTSSSQNKVVISGKHTYSTQARTVLKKILEMKNAPLTSKQALRPTPVLRNRGPFIQ